MKNQKFKLSYMIPNAWFFKLRDMNTTNSHSHNKIKALPSTYSSISKQQQPRNPLCYSPKVHQLHTPTSRKPLTNTIHQPASSQLTKSTHTDQDLFLSTTTNYDSSAFESTLSFDNLPTTSCSCSRNDIKIKKPYNKMIQDSIGFDLIQDIELKKLPPIITKPKKSKNTSMVEQKEDTCIDQSSVSIKIIKENIHKKETQVKIRSNSPKTKVFNKKIVQGDDHKSFKSQKKKKGIFMDNCTIVKSSFDPRKDLKESMMEMIVENNIWESKDLQELLDRYLFLNSEYHDIIVDAFEEIRLTFDFGV